MESATSGGEFIAGVAGFQVLRQVIQLDMATRDDDAGVLVVFDMISAQARVLVTDVDIAIGIIDLADLALLFRFECGLFFAASCGGSFGDRLGRFFLRGLVGRGGGILGARQGRVCERDRQQQ